MFVRKVKRKTTRNIAVQIVRNDRTKEGKVRRKARPWTNSCASPNANGCELRKTGNPHCFRRNRVRV